MAGAILSNVSTSRRIPKSSISSEYARLPPRERRFRPNKRSLARCVPPLSAPWDKRRARNTRGSRQLSMRAFTTCRGTGLKLGHVSIRWAWCPSHGKSIVPCRSSRHRDAAPTPCCIARGSLTAFQGHSYGGFESREPLSLELEVRRTLTRQSPVPMAKTRRPPNSSSSDRRRGSVCSHAAAFSAKIALLFLTSAAGCALFM